MRATLFIFSILFLVLTHSSDLLGQEKDKLDQIRWILGDWTRMTEKETTSESWTDTGDGIFKGQGSVTFRSDGNVRSRESLLLVEMAGEVFYIAKVKENEFPVPFKLTSTASNLAVFENTNHDFPKRLEYRLDGDGKLKVTISDGGKRSFDLQFSRVEQPTPKKKS